MTELTVDPPCWAKTVAPRIARPCWVMRPEIAPARVATVPLKFMPLRFPETVNGLLNPDGTIAYPDDSALKLYCPAGTPGSV